MCDIKLISLDLDGTLFNNSGIITEGCKKAIADAAARGVTVILCTGRPFCGIPLEQIRGTGIRYAITTNGSGIYETDSGSCLYECSMEPDLIAPILEHLLTLDIHLDAFIGGKAYSPSSCRERAYKLDYPPSLMDYILNTRIRVDHLVSDIRSRRIPVQKVTMNFYPLADGTRKDRDQAYHYLNSIPQISCVSGGYGNLEFTRNDVSKGNALRILADRLQIPMEATMAIGDTENDLAVIQAAGLGVAMGNATPEVKAAADLITASNEEDGVAKAICSMLRP